MKLPRLKTQRLLACSLIAGALLSTQTAIAEHWQPDKAYQLTILHTNDHHGRFWHNKYGEYGMAARKTLIDKIRAEVEAKGGKVLLLSGGDINTGVPESDLQDAEPDFKGMKMIGYDAMALGNHEFDNSLDVLFKQRDWAKFPFLSANIYDEKTGKRLFEPYHIFDKHGIKIAVIGLTTEDTKKIGNPEFISDIEFRDPKAEAKTVIAELKDTVKPDLIFAVTHMGHYQDGQFGVNAPGDVSLARYLNKGDLDMIIGGHSQEPVCMEPGDNTKYTDFKPGDDCLPDRQNGTWIVQAHEWGKYVGRADYTFKNGELELEQYKLIPINLKKKIKVNGEKKRVFVEDEIPADEAVYDFLKPYREKGQKQLNVKIATSNGKLEGDRDVVRFKQTNLGRLIATAQKERAKADFGIMNSGGVRDSIAEGDITYKDVLKVQPFANNVSYVDMKGDDVLKYLDKMATFPVDTGAFPQFSPELSMTIKKGRAINVKLNGKPIDPDKTYRFSIPSFSASGGDGYPKLTGLPGYVNTGFVDAEVLKAYLEAHSPIDVKAYQPDNEIKYK
ncbi:MAG: bifunctional UDP-sugar hydrolase/5'-nucleotidase [Gammaproteobacteria bacterium]|nr:MAG: bifunctional UDP-sugar hydrolase/5'-nucleotidase [Gammaproteobacteria bacterium]